MYLDETINPANIQLDGDSVLTAGEHAARQHGMTFVGFVVGGRVQAELRMNITYKVNIALTRTTGEASTAIQQAIAAYQAYLVEQLSSSK